MRPAPTFVLKNVSLFFRLTANLQSIPFTWPLSNPNSLNNPLILLNLWKLPIWHLMNFSCLSFTIYCWVDLFQMYKYYLDNDEFIALVLNIVWCGGYSLMSCFRIHQFRRRREIVSAINQLLLFVTNSVGEFSLTLILFN